MQFLPFDEIKTHKGQVLAVDCHHPQAFPLSHWKGVVQPDWLKDDTSAGIVLNAIKQNISELAKPFASNNHFDIDGFLGVWSLFNPQLAIENEALIRQMALIGDFREYNPHLLESEKALQLVCWINSVERLRFYAPFGKAQEAKSCVEKYKFFLYAFTDVLQNPLKFKKDWEKEYNKVIGDYQSIEYLGNRIHFPALRMMVVTALQPVHYYALYAKSEQDDMVLSIYPNNQFELEYKYTTWVTASARIAFPRIDLMPLAAMLNQLETSGFKWITESYKDTAPILRLEGEKLSKEQRYDHPYERKMASSSIPAIQFLEIVKGYFSNAYRDLEPKKGGHSWAETKVINEKLEIVWKSLFLVEI